jgi:hypothetical protein
MELDVLYSHIASPPVAANFAALVQRTVDKEIPHGVDIIVGIHARILKERRLLSLKPGSSTPLPSFSFFGPSKQAELAVGASDAPATDVTHETGPHEAGPPPVDERGARSGSLPPEGSEPPTGVPPQTSTSMEVPTATSTKESDAEVKKKATVRLEELEE